MYTCRVCAAVMRIPGLLEALRSPEAGLDADLTVIESLRIVRTAPAAAPAPLARMSLPGGPKPLLIPVGGLRTPAPSLLTRTQAPTLAPVPSKLQSAPDIRSIPLSVPKPVVAPAAAASTDEPPRRPPAAGAPVNFGAPIESWMSRLQKPVELPFGWRRDGPGMMGYLDKFEADEAKKRTNVINFLRRERDLTAYPDMKIDPMKYFGRPEIPHFTYNVIRAAILARVVSRPLVRRIADHSVERRNARLKHIHGGRQIDKSRLYEQPLLMKLLSLKMQSMKNA